MSFALVNYCVAMQPSKECDDVVGISFSLMYKKFFKGYAAGNI